MASTTTLRLFLLFLLTISFSFPSEARPCKFFFVSFSVLRHPTLHSQNPFSQEAVIIDIAEFKSSAEEALPLGLPRQDYVAFQPQQQQQPFSGFFYDFASLPDRTQKVIGLLFGLCSGALACATMYLAFSFCNSRDEDDFADYDDDKDHIKKMGYVNIPNDVAPVKSVV